MPKAIQYKANSIVYFKGDSNEKVFILKSGQVSLKYNDIETGQDMHDLIKTGEFFGVKSALGKYPREETAVVIQDASMIVFSVPEFEQVVLKNTRIIMKMLRVFSNQLRRIHKQVQNLLSKGEQAASPEVGLYKIGNYYLKSRKHAQALYAFRQYLTYYPSGKFSQEAVQGIEKAEFGVKSSFSPAIEPSAQAGRVNTSHASELSGAAKAFYNAVSLFSQNKFDEALDGFKQLLGADEEYSAKSYYEIGRCLFSLEQYENCIKQFTEMIQKYPKHSDLSDALFYVGNCYEKMGDVQKAGNFYKKIQSMVSEDEPVFRKAKKALRKLEGK
jgi:TolA-binding protein